MSMLNIITKPTFFTLSCNSDIHDTVIILHILLWMLIIVYGDSICKFYEPYVMTHISQVLFEIYFGRIVVILLTPPAVSEK